MNTLPVKALLLIVVLFLLALPIAAAAPPLPPFDWWPVPSPDGTHVAFTRVFTGLGTHMTVEVVDLKTKRVSVIASSQSQLDPTWSPDSKQVAYAAGGVLWVVRADGTGQHRYLAPVKAFAPAWRPNSTQLAYLTTHGSQNTDLWVGGALWARNVIGRPAWSPDGSAVAFQRDDGIYVATGPGAERQVAAIANPGPPAWSHDGRTLAYGVVSVVFTVPADGSAPPTSIGNALGGVGQVSWRSDGARLAVAFAHGVSILRPTPGHGAQGLWIGRASGPGVAYPSRGPGLFVSAAAAGCGGRVGIAELIGGRLRQLTDCGAAGP